MKLIKTIVVACAFSAVSAYAVDPVRSETTCAQLGDQYEATAEAKERFAEANSAYEIVGDKKKRGQFDRGEIDNEGKEKFAGFGGPGGQGNPFAGMHRQQGGNPFGGNMGGQRSPGGQNKGGKKSPSRGFKDLTK